MYSTLPQAESIPVVSVGAWSESAFPPPEMSNTSYLISRVMTLAVFWISTLETPMLQTAKLFGVLNQRLKTNVVVKLISALAFAINWVF